MFVSPFVGETPETLRLETRLGGSTIPNLMAEIGARKFAEELLGEGHSTFGKMFLIAWEESRYPTGAIVDGRRIENDYWGLAFTEDGTAVGHIKNVKSATKTDPRRLALVAVIPPWAER